MFSPTDILIGFIVNKTEKALDSLLKALVNHWQQEKTPINDDLEKALRRSLCAALQSIARDCHQELRGSYLIKYRGNPIYPPEHQNDLQWLDRKIKQLARELKQIEQTVAVTIPLVALSDLEALLTPLGQLTEQCRQSIQEKLLAELFNQDEQMPECYKTKLRECLFQRISDYFTSEIKQNTAVKSLYEVRLLTQIHQELQSPAKPRLNITLDVSIQELETVPLEEITRKLQQLSGDNSLTIRLIKEGSIVIEFQGSEEGLDRIQALFREGELQELLGISVVDVRLKSAIATPFLAETATNLSQWLQDVIDAGWQVLEEILTPPRVSVVFATREASPNSVIRGKLIDLGSSALTVPLALVVDVFSQSAEEKQIRLQVHPTDNNVYLPVELTCTVLEASGKIVKEAQAKTQDRWIQFEIQGKTGEEFSVKIELEDASVTHNFVI